jgi:hypothetical protein
MNSVMERWIQPCRHELLDRTLLWNQTHLLHAYASTNATITIIVLTEASETPDRCGRYPNRSPIPRHSPVRASTDTIASAASSTNTIMRHDLRGRVFGTRNAADLAERVQYSQLPETSHDTQVPV